jgi:acetyltransferase-like isoleucine patch superfamily enzyme
MFKQMNFFYIVFKNLFINLIFYVKKNIRFAIIQMKNPTCKFYRGSEVLNSGLGNYNVLFYDTLLINCSVGSHTYIQKNSTLVNATIGKFCSIASNVTVGPGIHKTDGVSTHPAFYLKNTPLVKVFSKTDQFVTSKQTNIGHDVWIGEKAIVIDGVKVGTGAIIASGAVVTKDVEPYSIVGGVPAKHIKFRFNKGVCEQLLETQWWDRSEGWLEQNFSNFTEPNLFIQKRNFDEVR